MSVNVTLGHAFYQSGSYVVDVMYPDDMFVRCPTF